MQAAITRDQRREREAWKRIAKRVAKICCSDTSDDIDQYLGVSSVSIDIKSRQGKSNCFSRVNLASQSKKKKERKERNVSISVSRIRWTCTWSSFISSSFDSLYLMVTGMSWRASSSPQHMSTGSLMRTLLSVVDMLSLNKQSRWAYLHSVFM